MTDTDNSKIWVNTLMDKEDVKKLDEMVEENGSTRAAFVRLLIDREYDERQRSKKLAKTLIGKAKGERIVR